MSIARSHWAFGAAAVLTTFLVSASDAEAPEPSEQLIGQPPPGWTEAFASNREGFRLVEYVPEGGPEQWIEKVTFEATRVEGLPNPIDYVEMLAQDRAEGCAVFQDHYIFSGYENGYPTSVRMFACRRMKDADNGELALLKVIAGAEFQYTVRWEKRVPAFDQPEKESALPLPREEIGLWSAYLRAISLCDPTSEDHPCPVKKLGAVEQG